MTSLGLAGSVGSGRGNRPAVLLVDDESDTPSAARRVLGDGGYEVVGARSSGEALDLLNQQRFAAVVLDKQLPGVAGIELVKAIRVEASGATVPILVVTRDSTAYDRIRGLYAGATDCMSKPFNSEELIARVAAQVRWHDSWSRLMQVQLRERSLLESALWRLNPEATPELTAELICEQLRRVRDINACAVISFQRRGGTVPLAVHDLPLWDLETGHPLADDLATYLRSMAWGGPWIERREDPATLARARDAREAPGMMACAPLVHYGRVLGLLVLTTDVPGGESKAGERFRALSAAIDFADIASGLLGPGLDARTRERSQAAIIDEVLTTHAFHPVFEPIVRLSDGKVSGYEALTRFDDGTGPEARFLMAASVNRGVDLERATLHAAVEACDNLPDDCFVSLNVSAQLVLEDDTLPDLLRRVHRPVVIELSEHDPIQDYEGMREILESLGDSVRLSIDDAGSGFASLQHVLALEPAFVKLDKTWVIGINDDPARQALIAGLSHFASQTGCHLIAEGVETIVDLRALRGLDVELGQGHLFGPAEGDFAPVEDKALFATG